jgi:hypothetical protein
MRYEPVSKAVIVVVPQADHDEPATIHRSEILARAFSTEVSAHCGFGELDPELVVKQYFHLHSLRRSRY